ncbi:MAG TPA: PqqD family protein [Blastocatellia bacterium]|nr:PqqD family protein [Blastocatellia bacterium]
MVIEKLPAAVYTPLDDGTGVLLNLDTLVYYSLNRTAAAVWQRIQEGKPVAFEDLVRRLVESYEVTETDARRHLGEFVDRLDRFSMIRVG